MMPNAHHRDHRGLAATANDDADQNMMLLCIAKYCTLERTPDDIASTRTQVPRVSCGGLGKTRTEVDRYRVSPHYKKGHL
jgi:hypothetical protein